MAEAPSPVYALYWNSILGTAVNDIAINDNETIAINFKDFIIDSLVLINDLLQAKINWISFIVWFIQIQVI